MPVLCGSNFWMLPVKVCLGPNLTSARPNHDGLSLRGKGSKGRAAIVVSVDIDLFSRSAVLLILI